MTEASWHDEAIRLDEDDEFGRTSIADHIARLVAANHTWEASRVYGLTGPWGSGKSSVINMVCKRLERRADANPDERWVVAHFTPWATNSTDALLVEFYSAFSAALGGDSKTKKARKALATCLQASAPLLGMVPTVGTVLKESAQAGSARLTRQEPWQEAFNKFTATLRELRVRVLVVADDIDRLQHDELVTLLKVVRLLGRFPGVDYLLAYDEATLFANLTEADIGTRSADRARLFMEKIVQYPLALPPLLAHQILGRVNRGFTAALSGRTVAGHHRSRIEEAQDLLVRQLVTPRGIDRYLAQARFVLSMHPAGESDETDLLLVTLLHLQFPTVYARLHRWRGHLTGRKSISDLIDDSRGTKTDFDPLFNGLDGDDRDDAVRLVGALFPIVTGGSGRGAPHISDHFYFDRYLVHMVPDDDIADAAIANALEQTGRMGIRATTLRKLLTDESVEGLPDLALDKMRRAWASDAMAGRDGEATLNLISAIAEVLPALESGLNSFFRRRERAIHWIGELIRSLPQNTDARLLSASIAACPDLILRMRIVRDALQVVGAPHEEPLPPSSALSTVATDLAKRAAPFCLDHLRQRDDADLDFAITFALSFVVREGDPDALRTQIAARLGADFTTEDLAARCVTLSYLVGPNPVGSLEGFADDLFVALAPDDDPFFDEMKEVVDPDDVSWANRRAFARGRAHRLE